MATFTVLDQNGPYTRVLVEFGEQAFEQTVLLKKPADLQAYANEYEADFAALPAEPAFVEAQE
jgi:hypothetical protein